MPRVSVIIPAYNASRTIAATIESVLAQTFRDYEVLVVDDGSKDDTREIVEKFGEPVRCLPKANGGVSSARNYGIEKGRGEYIAFLDADDLWAPEKLERQVRLLDANPSAGVCFAATYRVDSDLRVLERTHADSWKDFTEGLLLHANIVSGSCSSAVVRRDLVQTSGGFDSKFSQCADWDMWLRLSTRTTFVPLDEPLVYYRVSPGNMSSNIGLLERDTFAVLEKFYSGEAAAPYAGVKDACYSNHWMILSGSYLHAGQWRDAFRSAINGVRLQPSNVARILGMPFRMIRRAVIPSGSEGAGPGGRRRSRVETSGTAPSARPGSLAPARDDKRIRLLAIVPYQLDSAPSQRFRIEQWAPRLRAAGIEITFSAFENQALKSVLREPGLFASKARLIVTRTFARLRDIVRATRYDAVFLHREVAMIGPAFLERVIKALGVPVIYDFDDAIYLPPTTSPNGVFSRLKMPGKTKSICRIANHVFAGNPILAEYARRAGGTVSLIPTTIDMDKYVPARAKAGAKVTIGWSGSRTTSSYLELVREPLMKLRQRRDFKLLLIGCDPIEFEGIDVEILAWRADTEVADLNRIEIGLMPLPDDQWARGKCALKALQYMALGIPTVTSPVGVNADIIQDGVNGALASTTDEWVDRLEALAASPEMRERVGEAGRQTVLRAYSAESQVPRIVSIIQQVVRDARHPRRGNASMSEAEVP